jgi:hypothetical protein
MLSNWPLAPRPSHEHEVGAHAEVLALVEDDQPSETLSAARTASSSISMVGVDAVRLRLEGEPEDAVAEVVHLRAVVLPARVAPLRAFASVGYARTSTERAT